MKFKTRKPADMITVPGRIYPDEAARERLISFMRRFQAAKRTAYQALRRGKEPEEIVKDLYRKFFPNARWCQWALEDAKATCDAQKEQVRMHVSDLEAKIEKSEEKLKRTKNKLHRQGILARLSLLRARLEYWKGFLERDEVPPAVFGGKKNLLLLQEGKLSKEKWRELRSNAFYSVGQANQKGLEGQYGNANTEIVYDEATDSFRLNIYIPPEPGDKSGRLRQDEDWVSVPLEVPARYRPLLLKYLVEGRAYTVRVVRKAGRFDCFTSFSLQDEAEVDRTSPMAGMDLNPDVVAVTVVLPDGNFKVSRCFWCHDLVHASHEKREWIAGNLAKEVADWLESLGVKQVALEELSFAQDHDTNRAFNRITHNFCKKLLFNRIVVALRKRGIAVFTVPAHFTSLIGFFKYSETYGLNTHQAAALVVARRALGFKEKVPKALVQKLLGRSPMEGWTKSMLWGRLSGMFKATRKKVSRYFNAKALTWRRPCSGSVPCSPS
ncbi:transposase, IS605 OrfB family [Ammonifex degensii KC4]|uniref:Transposase, IS605 OrfB family n=1 Tax=Ammonifex degensii (strain DSM 10501 / KC4) TaxID=429009 RepID=C9RCQ6_AMMDK|nr:transposase, IS605 OrfB family [Ammonifex degensii KC4]